MIADILVLAAWLLYLGNAIIWTAVYKQMYPIYALSIGTIDSWNMPTDIAWAEKRYLRAQLAGYLISYSSLWLIKLSFLFFFRKLGNHYRAQRILWWAVLMLVIIAYGVTLSILDYACMMSRSVEESFGPFPYIPFLIPGPARPSANHEIYSALQESSCNVAGTGEFAGGDGHGHCIGRSQYVRSNSGRYRLSHALTQADPMLSYKLSSYPGTSCGGFT